VRIPLNRLRPVALVLAVLAAGCSARAATQRPDPSTLVVLERTDGASMNPLYAQTVQDAEYGGLVFDALTTIGPDYAPRPWLATSWTNTPDGLHWTVELRRGVTWSDGQPFTSKDVAFSYKLMIDPKVAFNGAGDLEAIKNVVAEGPYRVRFDLSHETARMLDDILAQSILPEHLLGKIPPDRQRFSSLGEHPVGTGAYMLQSWQHDSEAVFVRNPHWWHGPVNIPRLDFRIIFNDQAQVEALENGSADLIDDLPFTDYRQLKREAPEIKLMTFPSLYVDTTEVNVRRPGLSDVRVREAMMYGYDRDAIVKGFFDNNVAVADSLIPIALTRWHYSGVKKYPYDPARARALLDAAGWRVGPDGVRAKNGTRLDFELLVNQGSAFVIDEMLAFTADMRAIGIDVGLRQLDFPSLVQRTYAMKYDLIADARGGVTDPDYYTVLGSTQTPPAGANTTGYGNATVDHDLLMGLKTLDFRKRRAYYDQMQLVLSETLPMLYQYTRFAASAYSPRLELDPRTTLQAPLIWYNVFDWKLDP
jgi:peptide/nickel transport system substrate-binding protein